jgi:choline dehydrogenase-like flavoprotein
MPTTPTAQRTDFSIDIYGRYLCNGLDEALRSANPAIRPDARPFDMIVIGGGTFGAVMAAKLFNNDKTRKHRILVLEAGPVSIPEHQQNLPLINPGEVWGVPWNSNSPQSWNQVFPGLAFTVGGRSLFWGGWSPYFIPSELSTPPWPKPIVDDLTKAQPSNQNEAYLDQAARQIGTSAENDFVNETLQEQLATRLFDALKKPQKGATVLTGQRGALTKVEDLNAPLAVESVASRPGFFPFNKFSSVPLLTRASRLAYEESPTDDVRKRVMVAANTKVIRLEMESGRVARIVTNQGTIDVPPHGKVFLGLGTIENTRLALNTLPNANGLMGKNLMAHLRSNLTIRVPRSAFGDALDPVKHPELKELAVSALFVKGIHQHLHDGTKGHFHIQITASGVGDLDTNSEAELFKKIPEIELLDNFKNNTDQWIVITLRGIGEMVGLAGDPGSIDPRNRVTTGGAPGDLDYGVARAIVGLEASLKDLALWDAMDKASNEVALAFADGNPDNVQYLSGQKNGVWQRNPPDANSRRDTLSSTHHEGGTLWMGTSAANSVTDEWGRFHECGNLYALGPCLLPTLGSPNPMLSGVALARRTADHLVNPHPAVTPAEPGFRYLFDGTTKTFKPWLTAGQGQFALIDREIVAYPGNGLGLLWYGLERFGDFTLRVQFKLDHPTGNGNDNSGIFVRFRDPRRRVPDRNDPAKSYIYDNGAWVAVDTGFEFQIDEEARPNGADIHRTGAVYNIPLGTAGGQQDYSRGPAIQAGRWYDYEVKVTGQDYTTRLKEADLPESAFELVTTFKNVDGYRGKTPTQDEHSGYVGIQAHTGLVKFRNIRIKA